MFKFDVKFSGSANRIITKFTEDFKTSIINNGLDDIIKANMASLRLELKNFIDLNMRSTATQPTTTKTTKEEQINIPKSDQAVIEHLTGINIKEINITKNYKSSFTSNTCVVTRDAKRDPVVRLQMPVGPGDTVEGLFIKAREFFNNAVYVFPERNGTTTIKINGGFDLTKFTKIVCSTDTGVTDLAEKRYDRSWRPKGTVEFALKQAAIKEYIEKDNNGFLDITKVVNHIKNNELEEASTLIKNFRNTKNSSINNTLRKLDEKIEDLKSEKGVSEDLKTYQELINLINTIQLVKTITNDNTLYELKVPESTGNFAYFRDKANPIITKWIIDYNGIWFKRLEKKLAKLINRYTGPHV